MDISGDQPHHHFLNPSQDRPQSHLEPTPSRSSQCVGPIRQKHSAVNSLSPYSESRLQRRYLRPSSHVASWVETIQNSINTRAAVPHVEAPWRPEPKPTPPPNLEREKFIYRAERTLKVACAAENTIKATQLHLECRLREEELSIEVFRDEIKYVRQRSQAAQSQVVSLQATLQEVGITPKCPQCPNSWNEILFIDHAEKSLDIARATDSYLKKEELQLEGLVGGAELRIQALRNEIEVVRTRGQAARYQVASIQANLQSQGITLKPPPIFETSAVYNPSYTGYSDSELEDEEDVI